MPTDKLPTEQTSQAFFRWLFASSSATSSTGRDELSPEELVELHGRGLLTTSELLGICAYARLAALLDRRLLDKWQRLQTAADVADDFVELFDRTVLPEAQRIDLRSVTGLLKDLPPSLIKSITRTVSAYRLRTSQAPRKRLVGLKSAVFEHPSDRVALSALKAVPLMDKLVAWFVDFRKTGCASREIMRFLGSKKG